MIRPIVPRDTGGGGPLHDIVRVPVWAMLLNVLAVAGASLAAPFGYPWELASHFQHVIAVVAVALAVLALMFRLFLVMLLALGAAGLMVNAVRPVFDTAPSMMLRDAKPVRLLWANLQRQPRALETVLDEADAEEIDIVALTEVPVTFDFETLREDWPCIDAPASRSSLAVVFLAKTPCEAAVDLGPEPGALRSLALAVDEQTLTVIATHPTAPFTPTHMARRDAVIEAARAAVDNAQEPLVLVGDFNATPWSPIMRNVRATDLELVDCSALYQPTWSPFASRPIGEYLGLPIDFAYVGKDTVAGCRLGGPMGSDHLPLILDLVLPTVDGALIPSAGAAAPSPAPTP